MDYRQKIYLLKYFGYTQVDVDAPFFFFRLRKPTLSKFGPKNENFLFKLKCSTKTNLNVLNSMILVFIQIHGI